MTLIQLLRQHLFHIVLLEKVKRYRYSTIQVIALVTPCLY